MSEVLQPQREQTGDQKRALLAKLLREKAAAATTTSKLAHGQRALWLLYLLDRHSAAYNVMYAAHLRLGVDLGALRKAFDRLVERHAVLRTTYGMEEGQPVQYVHASGKIQLDVIDTAGWSQEELDHRLQAESDLPFDLENGPVVRVKLYQRANERPVLLFVAHHIALDFWSFELLFDELELLYRATVTGQPAELPPTSVAFTDFVRWQEKMLEGPQGQRQWEYWQQQLAAPLPSLDLPTDRPRPPMQTFRGTTYHFRLPDELSKRLAALTQEEGATLFATLLAAFQVLLFRISGQPDILVGSPTAGRSRAELEGVYGYFLNTIVLRARLDGEMTFRELLAQVRATVVDGIHNQDFPFPLLVERLQPPRDPSRSPIFQVAFGWDKPRRLSEAQQATGSADDAADSLGLKPFALGQQGAAFDLMLMILNIGSSLTAALQYNMDLFDEATIHRLAEHFQTLLEAIASNPQCKLDDLPLLSAAARQQLVTQWNATDADYPRQQCLHELFEQQAQQRPDAVAVSCGQQQLTYKELNERANRLARYLRHRGAAPDVMIGICVERSLEMLVGILGILKSGAAYVPLSPGTPAERLAVMLEDSHPPVLLATSDARETLPPNCGNVVLLDDHWDQIAKESAEPLEPVASGENLAYVIFTSGSTGRPKGVQIPHQAVVNFLLSMEREPGIAPDDVLLAVTTLTFDISVLELFLPLSVGAQVVIASRHDAADGIALKDLLTNSGATIMQGTPATWRLLIEAGWPGDRRLKVLCGGEALPRDLADALLTRCASLWNMYGPTETTIWSAVDRIQPATGPVLVGHPIANTQVYILDQRLRPVPIGVPGHLHIGGEGLARGYLNRPELTAEKFIVDPFRPGQRMYQTGDLARFRPDGRVEFLGRLDFQVKIRGYRIELGDIEAALLQHPAVREAVVVARQLSAQIDDKQLVAYLVAGAEPPNVSELREFLKDQLPDYMIPTAFVTLGSFPLNAAGKVDRKALPEPDTARPELRSQYVAARDEKEAALVEIWESILGLDQVGIHDDFFELGGASMQSLEVAAMAKRKGLDITPAMLFRHPTIAQVAAAAPAIGQTPPDVLVRAESVNGDAAVAEAKPHAAPVPEIVTRTRTERANIIIESLGIYLPPKAVTSKEVLKGCRKTMWIPLEKMTGIHSRRMCSDGEYCIDIATKAVAECLQNSKYDADDIELVICCNITRSDVLDQVSIEPNTSIQLKQRFGFKNAHVFDITNACTGMFTAVHIVEAFIAAGAIRRGMVVSGEYITGITKTAQIEISEFMDARLACLTVGDAGAAVILEAASNNDVGFHELEMYTLSKYSKMCIGKLTDQPHGGAILLVPDPMEHTAVAVEHSVKHAQYVFRRSPWSPEKLDHLIMHQTSDRSLRDGMRAINKAFGKKICNWDNTTHNLAERGNTASTTHFVALWDEIEKGKIKSGNKVIFGITGSGQTVGTGIYTFDDLPDRLRAARAGQLPKKIHPAGPPRLGPVRNAPRVEICSIGTLPLNGPPHRETVQITASAGEICLAASEYQRSQIDLLLFAGVTRSGYVTEPAIATLIAGEMKINDSVDAAAEHKTLAFDVYNASVGFLQACEVAARMIQAGPHRTAMVVTSEQEINAESYPDISLRMYETASAVMLRASDRGQTGFGDFVYHYVTDHVSARTIYGGYHEGRPLARLTEVPNIDELYLSAVPAAVEELLTREGLDLARISVVLPPQRGKAFNDRLAELLGLPRTKIIDVPLPDESLDLTTSTLPYSFEQALKSGRAQPGDIGLVINVASGVQVGAATYYF